ncbi:MAG TPA: hypothetical protein V6C89_07605 [Drouetiella sp.]|jgi:hypothetical protein
MNTLLAALSPQLFAIPEIPPIATSWQNRLVPETGVLLSSGKVGGGSGAVRNLTLTELEIVHALADVINSENASLIERTFEYFRLTADLVKPLVAALNLELAVTGRRKKFVVVENGWFKVRTFSGGVVFQRTLGK